MEIYRVNPGDTLWSIAKRYRVPVSQIITLNNLSYPYIIYSGQALVIYDTERQKTFVETLGYTTLQMLQIKHPSSMPWGNISLIWEFLVFPLLLQEK